jgi:peptidoglycan/LPS O-acetylase OafA/YrhL
MRTAHQAGQLAGGCGAAASFLSSLPILLLLLLLLGPLPASANCVAPDPLSPDFLYLTDMMGKSTFDLGNYDNCQANPVAQYCLMTSDGVQFGLCLPATCVLPDDYFNASTELQPFLIAQIEFLVLLDPNDATFVCGDSAVAPSDGTYAVLAVLLLFTLLAAVGTAVDRREHIAAWWGKDDGLCGPAGVRRLTCRRQGGGGGACGCCLHRGGDEHGEGADTLSETSSVYRGRGGGGGPATIASGGGGGGGGSNMATDWGNGPALAVPAPSPSAAAAAAAAAASGGLLLGRVNSMRTGIVAPGGPRGLPARQGAMTSSGRPAEPEYLLVDDDSDDGDGGVGDGGAYRMGVSGAPLRFGLRGATSNPYSPTLAMAAARVGGSINGGGGTPVAAGSSAPLLSPHSAPSAPAADLLGPSSVQRSAAARSPRAGKTLGSPTTFSPSSPATPATPGGLADLLLAFSLPRNWAALWSTDSSERVAVLDGVRALSCLFVVMGHTLQFMTSPGFTNWGAVASPNGAFSQGAFQIFPAATFATDSFFVLSGLCGTATLLHLAEVAAGGGVVHGSNAVGSNSALPALGGSLASLGAYSSSRSFGLTVGVTARFIGRRLVRLWPLYGAVLAAYVFVLPTLASGPFWPALTPYTQACQANWWTNLVFANNMVPFTGSLFGSCMPWTWYLAVDTQFYALLPLLVFVYLRQPSVGTASVFTLAVASVVAAEEIVNVSDLSAITDFSIQLGQAGPTQAQLAYYDQYFSRMWTRAPAFLLGVLLAIVLDRVGTARQRHMAAERQWRQAAATGNTLGIQTYVGMHAGLSGTLLTLPPGVGGKPPHTWSRAAQWLLLGLLLSSLSACVYGSVGAYASVPDPWPAIARVGYTILTRPAWSAALCGILFLCLSQEEGGGPVGWALRLPLWRPLARLSLAVYLLHPLWIQLAYYSRVQYHRYSPLMLAGWVVTNAAVAIALAIVAHLLVEAPATKSCAWAVVAVSRAGRGLRVWLDAAARAASAAGGSRRGGGGGGAEDGAATVRSGYTRRGKGMSTLDGDDDGRASVYEPPLSSHAASSAHISGGGGVIRGGGGPGAGNSGWRTTTVMDGGSRTDSFGSLSTMTAAMAARGGAGGSGSGGRGSGGGRWGSGGAETGSIGMT